MEGGPNVRGVEADMVPPWIIAELEKKRRERESERDERPRLEVELHLPTRQAPRPEAPKGPIVIEF
jgi:hypothetical protein